MEHLKFEVNGSIRDKMNATEAFLASNKAVTLPWKDVVEAVCLLKHKQGLLPEECIGFKVSEKQLILLFR
jgi:hypothetical protein